MNICVLCGGVGAAKFLVGLHSLALNTEDLNVSAIVNTGDDDVFYGHYVCPDIDTILYHLSGLNDEERGWGRKNETFTFVETLKELGIDAWFNLGDQDLALNNIRTQALISGSSLTQATNEIAYRLGINNIDVIPMCDEKVTTTIKTKSDDTLRMQEYFVREKCMTDIREIKYVDAPRTCQPKAISALESADLIVIAPSNPFLSIFPILAIEQINTFLKANKNRVVAISPIVKGLAIKGPLEKIMREQELQPSSVSIAKLYREYISTLIIDNADAELIPEIQTLGLKAKATNTIMDSSQSKTELANFVLEVSD